jgi:PAS domain S-box-containing protein
VRKVNFVSAETAVFNNAPIGIAEIDTATAEILYVNDEYCRIFCRSRESLVGRSWQSHTLEEDISLNLVAAVRLQEPGASPVTIYRHCCRPDGSTVFVKLILVPFVRSGGTPSLVAMMMPLPAAPVNGDTRCSFGKNVPMARTALINSLVTLAQFRDRETGGHLLRTKSYVYLLLDLTSADFPLSRYGKRLVANASMLHDIGKVGIPDALLLKKGPLTPEERVVMRTHPLLGARAIQESLRCTDYDVSMLFARDIVEFHHECWDGSGYPHGLKGVSIPYVARVMAIADVYDALRSDRPYKRGLSHGEAVAIIRSGSGRQFDPRLARTFVEHERLFESVSATGTEGKANVPSSDFGL